MGKKYFSLGVCTFSLLMGLNIGACSYKPEAPKTSYTVDFKNWNKALLYTTKVVEGELPVYKGSTPKRTSADGYTYTFKGWDHEFEPVYSNQTYIAEYDKTINYDIFSFEYISAEDCYEFSGYNYESGILNLNIPEVYKGKPVKYAWLNEEMLTSLDSVSFPDSVEKIKTFGFINLNADTIQNNYRLSSIKLSKNLKEVSYNFIVKADRHLGDETINNKLRDTGLFVEDDDGFYLPIGDNQYGLLVYMKNANFNSAVNIINSEVPGTTLDFTNLTNLISVGETYTLEPYTIVKTGDNIESVSLLECAPDSRLELGANIRYVNCGFNPDYEYGINSSKQAYVTVSENNPYFYTENDVIYSKDKTEVIFANNVNETVTLPSSVKSIRNSAFSNCSKLMYINFNEGLEKIGRNGFSDCYRLRDLYLPDSLSVIQQDAFNYCFSINRIRLGKNTFKDDIFYDLYQNLWLESYIQGGALFEIINNSEYVTNEELQASPQGQYIHYINDISDSLIKHDVENGFYYFTREADALNEEAKIVVDYDEQAEILHIPSDYRISRYALYYCGETLKKIIDESREDTELLYSKDGDPDNAYYIGKFDEIIYNCLGLEEIEFSRLDTSNYGNPKIRNNPNLKKIIFGNNIESMDDIDNCPNLETIEVNDALISSGSNVLREKYFPNLKYNVYEGCNYLGTKDNPYHFLVNEIDNSATTCKIADTCVVIGRAAFSEKTEIYTPYTIFNPVCHLVSLTLPSSVKYIRSLAFANCKDLTQLTLSNNIYMIDYGNFYGSKLTSVILPESLEYLWDNSFSDSSLLTSVEVRSKDLHIDGCFKNCPLLSAVNFVNNKYISLENTFSNCPNLTDLYLEFEKYTADTSSREGHIIHLLDEDHNEITKLEYPDRYGEISGYEFYNCKNLTKITISTNVKKIGAYAFMDCSSLSTIVYEGTMEQWSEISFGEGWATGVAATVVTCSDGAVEI